MIHIVLYQPEIPQNTGNIARLCVCNDFCLHLIHPLGFQISDKKMLRAGLDYWPYLQLKEHSSWETFEKTAQEGAFALYFFSKNGEKSFWEAQFTQDVYLIFGSETRGLPSQFRVSYESRFFTIPMKGIHRRCLNLSNAVTAAAYEALRQSASKQDI